MRKEEVKCPVAQKRVRLNVEPSEVNLPADRVEIILILVVVEASEANLPPDRERCNPQEDLGVVFPLVAVKATEVDLPADREQFNPKENLGAVVPLMALERVTANHWEATRILGDLLSSSKITSINHLLIFC